jgi:hypothetical protein
MDAADLNPITAAASAIEYVQKKVSSKPYPSGLSADKQKKFEEMLKQDFFKDDPYRDMWDPNWINK